MKVNWTSRLLPSAVVLLTMLGAPLLAQHGGPPGVGGGSSTGTGSVGSSGSLGGTGTRGTTGLPNTGYGTGNGTYGPNNGPYSTRPIFLSGKVMFDDGSPTNSNIRIERVCGGNVKLEAHTDGQGRFSFQVGQNPTVDTDVADSSTGNMGRTPGVSTDPSSSPLGGMGSSRTSGMSPLWNCELRASYAGYLSDSIDLANRRSLDDPNVGTIILRRAANVKGSTVSVTTAEAPKKAQKNYEKGLQFAQKGQLEQAEKHLQQATDIYPKYALAWFALGEVKEQENNKTDARKAYLQATSADSKYVSPLDRLALLSAEDSNWPEAADYSARVIEMNPIEFPGAFWYNAIANFNMKKIDLAGKSATALVKLDTQHKYPEVQRMLAQIALSKNDYPNAAAHLRDYLVLNPNAKDADALKQTLLKMDQASAATKKQ